MTSYHPHNSQTRQTHNLLIRARILSTLTITTSRTRHLSTSPSIPLSRIHNRRTIKNLNLSTLKSRQLIKSRRRHTNQSQIHRTNNRSHHNFRISHRTTRTPRMILRLLIILPSPTINNMSNTNPMIIIRITSRHQSHTLRHRNQRHKRLQQRMIIQNTLTTSHDSQRRRITRLILLLRTTTLTRRRRNLQPSHQRRIRRNHNINTTRTRVSRHSTINNHTQRQSLNTTSLNTNHFNRVHRMITRINRRRILTRNIRQSTNMPQRPITSSLTLILRTNLQANS